MIEMMVVLVLVAIFALIGIPSYESATTTNRMAAEMNGFIGDLQYARSEAIQRGYDVSMCAADPATNVPTATNPQCLGSNTTGWSRGWVVYAPAFGGNPTTVLRIHAALTGNDSLVSNGTSSPGVMTFNRNGFFANSNMQSITLNDVKASVHNRRCAVLNMVGRVKLDTGTNCP